MLHAENGTPSIACAHWPAGDRPGAMATGPRAGGRAHRAIRWRSPAPLYIVHLSAAHALDAVTRARDTGQNFAETCPQYLFLSLDDLAKPDFEGAKYVASPPLRPKEHQAELWRGLRTNDLSLVSTDHCPFCFRDQKELGRGDFSKIPNGMPGVEHRMDLLYQGVVKGEITLPRWVEISSTTPARMFGLYPRKGVIAPGADADITVYDPTAADHMATHHEHGSSRTRHGADGRLLPSRGQVVVNDNAPRRRAREFLKRDLSIPG
jgi:dihydropyrimidinase